MIAHLVDFLYMGGYAAYVWSAYGITFVALLINALLPLRKKRILLEEIKDHESKS